jgi:hypothetical protein
VREKGECAITSVLSDTLYRQLVWDYVLDKGEFLEILSGKKQKGWFTQEWAIARVLEYAPYYQARQLIPLTQLREHWDVVRLKIRREDIKKGYDFVLRHHALSTLR